ncbi:MULTISPECIES: tRNA pseudouridine(55) synthase TruB [unclassified Polaromonas]|uniref:tRNA pseudouridine(55) synthase TruB n=1 Tax=unclassified Polaromonas TaxID=2638319 RepID=UPI0018C9CF8F|nr:MULTISPECIES: tRNA pseudouridine(55) synthase TruB [unclassified Polaromonas]MBG6073625.1 tRNA pseudouridine55 synthase [Polaromonas sp. CG_9.7]MBG6115596.1 tRNA pseudouridine55 synthase [Polaromonas sp. CG_9.2]MDH6185049.1 tRNA pseudouridine55 synthase [Polaromonas sp. CG_23.6]
MTQTTSTRQKIQRRPVHGVLLLDKPLGLSSNQALQKAKWLLRAEKAGHTGTLDPLATGVLPLCFGAATKFSQMQLEADKTYEAVLLLGQKTSTADAEGEVIETRPVPVITPELLETITRRFTGPLAQVPPMYSALKKDGKALYEYARKGIEVEREARHITIFKLNMALAHDPRAQAAIKIIVSCSKGTYIRTLGEDIGEAIGCGAHLGSLRRIETGGFVAAQCVTLAALEAMNEAERDACLLPPQSLVADYPFVTLDADNAGRFLSGLRRRGQWGADAPLVQVYGNEPAAFLGSAHICADELIPQRLLSPVEVQDILQSSGRTYEVLTPVSVALASEPTEAGFFQH